MLTILYYLFIFPIYLLLEILFHFFNATSFPVVFIIFLISYFINLLSLPMYMSATRLQNEEQELQDKMAPKIRQIKQNFKGAERFMMLSTYYRQNHYHPIMALRKSLSIAIQIPFFIAAYLFFSHLEMFHGMPLGFIKDLGAPDGAWSIGNFHINILPIIMTLLNLASAQVYAQHLKTRDKIQLYIVPLVFLALLYSSPAGLVLYWTFNNFISLVRNIILRFKNAKKIFYALNGLLLLAILVQLVRSHHIQWMVCILSLCLLFLPTYAYIRNRQKYTQEDKNEKRLFWIACLTNSICLGLLIPSNTFISSPLYFSLPLLFVIFMQALGFCLILPGALYLFTQNTLRRLLLIFTVFITFISALNIVWANNQGQAYDLFTLSIPAIPSKQIIINFGICLLVSLAVAFLFARKKIKGLLQLISIILIAAVGLSLFNCGKLMAVYVSNPEKQETVYPKIHLSKTGKNVLVLMMDRSISSFLPAIFEEKPELRDIYTGFTHFPNTISYYSHTILGLPPILGGYEYIPTEMDKRPEKVVDKFNEAILTLPTIFKNNNFDTLVADVDWADFKEGYSGDLFKRNQIGWEHLDGRYNDAYIEQHPTIAALIAKRKILQKRQGFMYSLYRIMPAFLKDLLYDKGNYLSQTRKDPYPMRTLRAYPIMHFLPGLTDFTASKNTFTFMVNLLAHDISSFLEYPSYELTDKFVQGDNFRGDVYSHQAYHTNAASLLLIGKFLQYLKENGVYDNTRIIIVSDHGALFIRNSEQSFLFNEHMMPYNAMLLVKDFNATGPFKTDKTFMTNADVPLLALAGLVNQPKNPFTGKLLTNQAKQNGAILFESVLRWNPSHFSGSRVFDKDSTFLYVKDDIFNPLNYVINYKYDTEKPHASR